MKQDSKTLGKFLSKWNGDQPGEDHDEKPLREKRIASTSILQWKLPFVLKKQQRER